MRKILFVCTGNTCRSPMAEGLFNDYAAANNIDAIAESAGIFVTEHSVSKNAITAMSELGIDISAHIPMQISDYIISESDLILTMTKAHKDYLIANGATSTKVFTLSEYVGDTHEISDPYGGDIDLYRNTAREIKGMIEKYENK